MIEIDELTLHWLAGLLEGEGSFCAGIPARPYSPLIIIKMTDEDTISKVASLFKVKYHLSTPERYREKGWKSAYSVRITGKHAVQWMVLLRPLMGKRRQSQIDKAIACYQEDTRKVLSSLQMEELRQRALNGENVLKLATEYGISKSLAYYIRNGYTYKET
jgi:hypothetical protein